MGVTAVVTSVPVQLLGLASKTLLTIQPDYMATVTQTNSAKSALIVRDRW